MMRAFFLFVLFLIGGIAFAQDPVIKLDAQIFNDDNGKKMTGSTIEVLQDGKPFVTETSASNGRVPIIDLPVGHVYTIRVKKAGYVTKLAKVDAHFDYPEDLGEYTPLQFKTSLFTEVEGIDFSFLENTPMIEFEMDAAGIVIYDPQKLKAMQKKIEDLKKKMEEKKEELEKEEKEKAKRQADFDAYVKAGDAAVSKKDYEKGIGQYELALGLIPDDKPTQEKLENAKIKLEELRNKEQQDKDFAAKMAEAKTAYSANDLEKALGLYKEASGIKPDEKLPKDLIAEIEAKLAEQKKNEEAFNSLVAAGDAATSSDSFDEAINKYEEALKLKKDSGVQKKLDDVKKKKADAEQALAAEKETQEKYDQLIAKADAAFDTEKYEEAKSAYQEALTVKSGEAKPTNRITEIDKILADRAAEQAAAEKLEADYKKAMAEGKEAFNQRKWDQAKSKYEAALVLKPNDPDALAQIDLINKEAAQEAEQAKLDEEYNSLMAEAKSLFDGNKLEDAKSKYNEALGVKPSEKEPKDKIAEIDRLLADAAKTAEIEAEYKKLMDEGNALNDNKDYTGALDKYKKALNVKPGDSDATAKIDAINKIIEEQNRLAEEQAKFDDFVAKAEEAFNAKNYDQAKLNYNNALDIKDDSGIRAKIKEIDDIIAQNQSAAETQAKYDAAIKAADDLYKANDDQAALDKYKEALSIKDEDYPKQKISELTEKIALAKAAAEKDEQFNNLIAEADAAFDSKEYGTALAKYKEAIAVKPDPTVSQKIAELNVLIAEESKNAAAKEKYDAKIKEADAAFDDENWNGARALYEEARNLMPSESYPSDQITEIERRMAEESAAEAEKNYQKIIDKANGLLDNDKLDEATTYYERALTIKPSDQYPKDQIEKIKQIKADRANAVAEQERLEREFESLIADGDAAFNAQNWDLALSKYKESLNIKPDAKHPKDRIDEIGTKLDAAEKGRIKDAEYQAVISQADNLFDAGDYMEAKKTYEEALGIKPTEQYPKDQITKAEEFMRQETLNEEEAAYQKMLAAAQKKFDAKEYDKALDLYLRAKTTKPSDPLPQQRIDEINQILTKLNDEEKNRKLYDDYITQADNLYEKGEWKDAKEKYTAAYNLFNEEYPERRIRECEEFMKKKTDDEVNKNYNKIIKKADEYFGKANYTKAKGLYERALGIKPSDAYPKSQLEEIDKILNPNKFAKTKNGLRNYGDPNRSVNAIDIDAMLADAEEERKYMSVKKIEKQRQDAIDLENSKDQNQTDYNFNTEGSVRTIGEDISRAGDEAQEALKESVKEVDGMQTGLVVAERDRVKDNENTVQLQNQVVNNLNKEVAESQYDSDVPREEYEANVEKIHSELIVENTIFTNNQTNETFDQKGYVEDYKENRIEADVNNDINRKNTEVHVEDFNIRLINESNENAWDQEDVIIDIKDDTEHLIDEQIVATSSSDIPREEGVSLIEQENLNRVGIESTDRDNQYDVTIGQKEYTETILNEIEIESIGNDLPREQMEDFTENQTVENIDANRELVIDQDNVLFSTDEIVESLEIDIVEKNKEDDKNREGYEVTVDEIKENESEFLVEKDNEIENENHEVVDYLEDRFSERRDDMNDADQKADDNIDNTSDMVQDITDENAELDEKSKVDLENAEDFVESLRDIKVNEIDEKMKNDLGSQFPEGVTEEIYTINDEDGLIVSYVVRRVVVRNGVGNVYEKVQTKFGTTSYTVNGSAISEFDWQDQTEAADLARN